MDHNIYRYKLSSEIPIQDVTNFLLLSILATESVYGRSRVRMGMRYLLDEEKHCCVLDASNEVGKHASQIFTGFLSEQFGDESFKVEEIESEEKIRASLQNKVSFL